MFIRKTQNFLKVYYKINKFSSTPLRRAEAVLSEQSVEEILNTDK